MTRIQFNVRQLLVLTTVVAVVLGVVVALDLPGVMQSALVGGYLAYLAAWLTIRGPSVIRGLRDVRRRRGQLTESRRTLSLEVEAKREAFRIRARDGDALDDQPQSGDRQ